MTSKQERDFTRSETLLDMLGQLAGIDEILMKGQCITIQEDLQKQASKELHSKYMGVQKHDY